MTLELARVLSARQATVWGCFTDPGRLASWWGPRGFSIPSLDFEPAPGRGYRIQMQPPEGDAFFLAGEFRVVDPEARLAFTFNWEPANPDDVETVADLAFRGQDDATEVRLEQGSFRTEERRELHRGGWTESFDKLQELLALES
jgi:uncharacterized protein YndB with AHSA1/START domain